MGTHTVLSCDAAEVTFPPLLDIVTQERCKAELIDSITSNCQAVFMAQQTGLPRHILDRVAQVIALAMPLTVLGLGLNAIFVHFIRHICSFYRHCVSCLGTAA